MKSKNVVSVCIPQRVKTTGNCVNLWKRCIIKHKFDILGNELIRLYGGELDEKIDTTASSRLA